MLKAAMDVISSLGEERHSASTISIKTNTIYFMRYCDVKLNQDLSAALWFPEALSI